MNSKEKRRLKVLEEIRGRLCEHCRGEALRVEYEKSQEHIIPLERIPTKGDVFRYKTVIYQIMHVNDRNYQHCLIKFLYETDPTIPTIKEAYEWITLGEEDEFLYNVLN